MVLVGLLVRYVFGVTLYRLSRKWRKLPQIHYRLKSGGRIGSVHEKHHGSTGNFASCVGTEPPGKPPAPVRARGWGPGTGQDQAGELPG